MRVAVQWIENGVGITLTSRLHEARSCGKKVRYSKASAVKAAAKMALKKGEPFDTYECLYCGKFHIGHSLWDDV